MSDLTGFNKNHPERRPGEVYITNTNTLHFIGWKTKRQGEVAYSNNGKIVTPEGMDKSILCKDSKGNKITVGDSWFPVFAKITDVLMNSTLCPGIDVLSGLLPDEEYKKVKASLMG